LVRMFIQVLKHRVVHFPPHRIMLKIILPDGLRQIFLDVITGVLRIENKRFRGPPMQLERRLRLAGAERPVNPYDHFNHLAAEYGPSLYYPISIPPSNLAAGLVFELPHEQDVIRTGGFGSPASEQ